MNQKQVKRIRKWTKMVWEGSSDQDKSQFNSFEEFESKVLKDAKAIPNFKYFVRGQLEDVKKLSN